MVSITQFQQEWPYGRFLRAVSHLGNHTLFRFFRVHALSLSCLYGWPPVLTSSEFIVLKPSSGLR